MAEKILSAKELREELAPLAGIINELADLAQKEQRVFNAEEQAKWDKVNGEYNRLKNQLDLKARAEALVLEMTQPAENQVINSGASHQVPGREDYNGREALERFENAQVQAPTEADHSLALQGWMRARAGMELLPIHAQACQKCKVRPHLEFFDASLRNGSYSAVRNDFRKFRNAQSASDGSLGSYTVAEGFVPRLEIALLQYGGMRQASDVMRTDTGADMPWPTSDDTSNKGAIIGESSVPDTQDVSFGQVIFRAHKWTSKFVKVPFELLEDSAFNLASILGDMLGERLGRIQNEHYTTGTGVGQPMGFVNAAATFTTGVAAGAIDWDDVIGLEHSVDPAYRAGSIYMAHDTVISALRLVKDGQGRPIWTSGAQAGVPDTINGKMIVTNNDMASTLTSGSKSLAFGDFSKYKIRDVNGVRLVRLNERFADADQIAFVAFARGDGNLLNAGVAPIKVLTHP